MKKVVAIFCLILSLVMLFVACSANDPTEEKIDRIVQLIFTIPNEELINNEVLQTAVNVDEVCEELKILFPDMVDICTDTAFQGLALPMGVHFDAAEENVSISVSSTEVKVHSAENHTYIVNCVLMMEGKEKNEVEISGKMQVR